jgi:hypothetical protein
VSFLNPPLLDPVGLYFGSYPKMNFSTKEVYIPFFGAAGISCSHGGGNSATLVFGERESSSEPNPFQFTGYMDGEPVTWEYFKGAEFVQLSGISVTANPIERWPYSDVD